MNNYIILLLVISMTGCSSISVDKKTIPASIIQPVAGSGFTGYRAIDPLPVSKVEIFDSATVTEKEVFWASITDKDVKRSLLPIQSSQVSVTKTDSSGSVSYLTASVSGESGCSGTLNLAT